jgi:N6-adenosine-specific RNA methylase IME4
MLTLPEGPFDVLLADPPWHYRDRGDAKTRFGRGAWGHYRAMSTEEILSLAVEAIVARPSLLYLWATWPCLPDAMAVMQAWGFAYSTVGFLWVKTNPSGEGIFHGPGYYAKANTEPCLLGIRGGSIKPAVDDVSSVIISPRREHSRKPDAVRTRIDRMYPTARKVELFARESESGWSAWGNQVDTNDWAKQQRLFAEAAQ